jgi:dTDP-4-amino-4,6-dideoxygalactose transaminase
MILRESINDVVKTAVDELAIFGGEPAFDRVLHIGTPNIGNREHFFERVNQAFDRRYLTNDGPLVRELEARIAGLHGVKHCALLSNGTAALEIAARALDLSGEVIVPAMTFVATAHAMQWMGLTPVFCDIDPQTHTLDPAAVEAAITPRTSAILGVHLWGRACDVTGLAAVAKKHALKLFYDAAHAFSCSANGQMIGNFGDLEVFSFHATKIFNTFEGGAMLTNHTGVDRKVRLLRNFGFEDYDQVVSPGTNGKMNEISAAMGLTLLEDLDELIETNHRNYCEYQQGLAGLPGIKLISYDERQQQNYQYIVLEIDEDQTGLSRDQIAGILWSENVLTRRYFYPGCHRMQPFASSPQYRAVHLPQTEALVERVLTLPTGTAVDKFMIRKICALLGYILLHAEEIENKMKTSGSRI